ncbi:MAG: hypothetical protein J6C33_08290, partial [Lachnospiraceae bacterium]|nr:hypothetical protein [Lachnospiraceae bacterium]
GYISEAFGFRGVLIRRSDMLYRFPDVYFASPQLTFPKAYWNERKELLVMSLHNMTGTGVSADELIAFSFRDPGDVRSFSFSEESLERQIGQNLTFQYHDTEKIITFYDGDGNRLGTQDVSELEGERVVGISALGLMTFEPGSETILETTVGVIVDGWASPYYNDASLVLRAPVEIECSDTGEEPLISFRIGGFHHAVFPVYN